MSVTPQYIAGFLDGEGNISILESNKYAGYWSYRLHVGFTNRDLRPLLAIKEIYGGCLFTKQRRSLKHQMAYELRIGKTQDVRRLLTDVLPYLIIKREQASLGLSFLDLGKVKMETVGSRKIHPTKGGVYPIRKAMAGEREQRAAMKKSLMTLNARGVM